MSQIQMQGHNYGPLDEVADLTCCLTAPFKLKKKSLEQQALNIIMWNIFCVLPAYIEGVKYFDWKDCKAPPFNFSVMTGETGQSVCVRINELLSVCQERTWEGWNVSAREENCRGRGSIDRKIEKGRGRVVFSLCSITLPPWHLRVLFVQ